MRALIFTLLFSLAAQASANNCAQHLVNGKLYGKEDQILCRTGYMVSYDYDTLGAQYVAYHLTRDRNLTRLVQRSDHFEADSDIPNRYRVQPDEFFRTGYDRGHLAAAETNRWSGKAQADSFLMTNIMPQHAKMNRGDWKDLEEHVRDLLKKHGELYVATGPIYTSNPVRTIGKRSRVALPDYYWKAVFIPSQNEVVAYAMPNTDTKNRPLRQYRVPKENIEQLTGLTLFSGATDAPASTTSTFDLEGMASKVIRLIKAL